MTTEVITAVVSGLFVAIPSIIATLSASKTTQKLNDLKIAELKNDIAILSTRVDKHNNLIERVAVLESEVAHNKA